MISAKSKQTIRALCPELRTLFIEDFLSRMDEDYFEVFSPEQIAEHIRMSSLVDAQHRTQVRIAPLPGNEFEIAIVGYNYPSGLSILCGLLSAFGLDIQTGDIYSLSKRSSSASSSRIVDVFRVTLKHGEAFDETRQHEFVRELNGLTELLAAGSHSEARERLNLFLIERLEKMGETVDGLRLPVELTFDNQTSADWTLMEARSGDAFGFLYAISNALAMRGADINKVKIRSSGGRVTDHFFIADRWGRKIEDGRDQQRLRTAVSMIKEFTRFLPEAPDPARALRHFDQFLDKVIEISEDTFPDHTIAFLASSEGMNMLAHLLGSSDFLWDDLLRTHFSELLPALEDFTLTELRPGESLKSALRADLRSRLAELPMAAALEEKKRIFNAFKDRHVFLIDAAHLVQPDTTLMDFSYALTDLGEVVVEEAARLCYEDLVNGRMGPVRADGTPCLFTILGLGKFGGREMGYASDFELLFVHESAGNGEFFESLVRRVVDFIETRSHGIFHIDLRLRPYGHSGAWSTPLDHFTRYYSVDGGAAPFERQALIKLRWVAGDARLGRQVEEHRDKFTYSGEPWDWADAMQLRRRQILELVKPGQTNVKYSAGGIVDIEYAVQYLQLLNGAEHPRIRLSNTLEALLGLRHLQIIRETDYTTLHNAYLFLRNLIDGLRIVRGDATDLVLPSEGSEEFKSLARRLGYRETERTKSAAHLATDVRDWMKKVHEYFVLRFDFEAQ